MGSENDYTGSSRYSNKGHQDIILKDPWIDIPKSEESGSKQRMLVEIEMIKRDLKELGIEIALSIREPTRQIDPRIGALQILMIVDITKERGVEHDDWALTNSIYRIYTSNYNRSEGREDSTIIGAAFAIHRDLYPYIHNIQTVAGTMVAIDFYFPKKKRYRLVSIYIPIDKPTIKAETERVLKEWTLSAKRNSIQIKRISYPTWQRRESKTQIDDFWIEAELAFDMDIVEMIKPKTITESDHTILKTTWHTGIEEAIKARLTTANKVKDTEGFLLDKK
ncbi:7804_t:CDS:2 [Gigaspora margarita]|uniref:7804_t:CDS:1 n=1 Tax=Gigaspora margarita TaxID=4874 RepID=A0ABN7UDA6_GIGMA|nr:7804_t:CDS:2 [Gigaspora margarita]